MTSATASPDREFSSDVAESGKGKGKLGASGLRCVVVTPEATILDESADFIALPLYDGELGIRSGRAAMIGRLGFGELRIRRGDSTYSYFVDGGFAQVRENLVTILTARAELAAQLNATQAESELASARQLPSTTEIQWSEKDRAVSRARAKVRVAKKASTTSV